MASSTNGIWDDEGYNRVVAKRTQGNHPIYEAVSCTIANALSKPESNGVYGTDACVGSNCPSEQRDVCSVRRKPTNESIVGVLSDFGIENMTFTQDESGIRLDGAVGEDIVTNLVLRFGVNVIATEGIKEAGYGWGNHHDRQQVFIRSSRQRVDFFNLDNEGIDRLQKEFWGLKQEFKKTELMPWNNLVFAGELNLQIGHFNSLLFDSEAKKYLPQVHDIADEAADIIFNVFNLASNLGINISTESVRQNTDDLTLDQLANEITVLGAVLWDGIAKADGYKAYVNDDDRQLLNVEEVLNSIIQRVCDFVMKSGLDKELNHKLEDLVKESRKFIDENSKS